MRLSIIIVNYNVRWYLQLTLESVYRALDGIDGEVIVVDNASTDGSPDMVQNKFPQATLIANSSNLGFGKANNIGVQHSNAEYILLLNPDTIIQEDTLRAMLGVLERNKEIGIAGCMVLNADGTLQLACRRSFPSPWVAFTKVFGLSTLFPHSQLFGRYNLTYLHPDDSVEVDAISGCFMMVRKRAFEEIGGFDEQFFMYGEDLDLCYRVQRRNWKVYYFSETQIIHFKGESVRNSNVAAVEEFYRAMRLFVRKHIRYGIIVDWMMQSGITLRKFAAHIKILFRIIDKKSAKKTSNTVFISNSFPEESLINNFRKRFNFLGVIADSQKKEKNGFDILGTIHNIDTVVKQYAITDIIFDCKNIEYSTIMLLLRNDSMFSLQYHFLVADGSALINKEDVVTLKI